jgi:hypothetical protein
MTPMLPNRAARCLVIVVAGLGAFDGPALAQAPPPGPPAPAPPSGSVRLRTQSACGRRTFRVMISWTDIAQVTLFVAGRRVRTVTMPAGARSLVVHVPVRRFGARRQTVQARITFTNGARALTLTAAATRCAATAQPDFTG